MMADGQVFTVNKQPQSASADSRAKTQPVIRAASGLQAPVVVYIYEFIRTTSPLK